MLDAGLKEGQFGSELLRLGEQQVLIPCQVGVVTEQTQPTQAQTETKLKKPRLEKRQSLSPLASIKTNIRLLRCASACMCVFCMRLHCRPLSLVKANVVLFKTTNVADCLAPHLSKSRQWQLCLSLPDCTEVTTDFHIN